MPIKSEKLHWTLPRGADRRRRLSDEQKEEVLAAYRAGASQRQLARDYGVSRSAIQWIVDPRRREKQRAAYKARGGWKRYYNKEKHRREMQRTRQYRKEIFNGKDRH